MKRAFILAGILCLLVGCGSKDSKRSDFDLAAEALSRHDTNALAAILARDKGVVTNVLGFDGSTLLHYSLADIPDIVASEMLVQAGADVNQRDVTGAAPLHIICDTGANPEAISFLIKHGADLNMRNADGLTPLQIALRRESPLSEKGIALLKQAGAKE